MKTAFLIASPTSGSGKTTIARGLMALLADKDYKVQPFKCGPDYIDTKFHQQACGRPSINLDTFMATPEHVEWLFAHYGADADICIVEGMMGLFDGYDRDRGSSAEIAQVLGLPIVLVVDAKSAAYSMAPLLSGFMNFRKDLRFAGVIFNKVASDKQQQMLRQVCDDLHIDCLGCLPRSTMLQQDSRYLGLDFSSLPDNKPLVQLLDKHICIERLLDFSQSQESRVKSRESRVQDPTRVLIARNAESFSFIYQEVIDSFASVEYFDPEQDVPSLKDIDLLYLPGGYPEKHLQALVANEGCRNAIKAYAEHSGRVVAECGGMMYLCHSILTDEGEYPMCSVLPYTITARSCDRKLSLGYRRFEINGKEYRGHEFHYTQFESSKLRKLESSKVEVFNARGERVDTPVFLYRNVLASYTHLYTL